jgi:hypothetical protein
MSCPDAQALAQSFRLTHHIIKLQTDGLSHTDSVLQPPFRGNCLNWVVGHIIEGRDSALKLMGEAPLLHDGSAAFYETGSKPITRAAQAVPLKDLLQVLEMSQQRLASALERTTPDELGEPVQFRGSEQSLGQAIAGLHWHETYHTGQLELLRQLAGTDDAII